MTGEIPHFPNGVESEETPSQKDFPVSGLAAHLMVGLPSMKELRRLRNTSGLPLTRVVQGGETFYMQSQLDALRKWVESQSTDNPMQAIRTERESGQRRVKDPVTGLTGVDLTSQETTLSDGAISILYPGVEVDLSSSIQKTPPLRNVREPYIPEGYIKIADAVDLMGVSIATWYRLAKGLEHIQLGTAYLYRISDVEILKQQRQQKKDERVRSRPHRVTKKEPLTRATSQTLLSQSSQEASTRHPQYPEKKRRINRNWNARNERIEKNQEQNLGGCDHHYWVEIKGGIEFGTCKKCGVVKEFNSDIAYSRGRRIGDVREVRRPDEINDKDIQVLDMALSGIAISEIALELGFRPISVRRSITKLIENNSAGKGLGSGIRGLLATGLLDPSFAEDLAEELNDTERDYLSALSNGLDEQFLIMQGESFNSRQLMNEIRRKMGFENDFGPIAWSIIQEMEQEDR